MTPFHRDNLRKLATYLMEGRCCYEFDMKCFRSELSCGTIACALGHGPDATGIQPLACEDWDTYGYRVFLGEGHYCGFLWCFGWSWGDSDNTARGAGQRILWMLKHGVPGDADKQRKGHAPLCYTHLTLDAPTPAVEPRRSERAPLTAGRPA